MKNIVKSITLIFALIFVSMTLISNSSFGASSPSCKKWDHIYNGYAGLEGYYCIYKPENNLSDVKHCKSWKHIYLSHYGIEGYVCDSTPSQITNEESIDARHCKFWIPVYNPYLSMDGYICKELL